MELPKTPEIAHAYASALVHVALRCTVAFASEPSDETNTYENALEVALCPRTQLIGALSPEGAILAAGAMMIREGLSARVATINQLYRSEAAPKGLGATILDHMIDKAMRRKCSHIVVPVLCSNLDVVPWYESQGFQVWHTDKQGDVWLQKQLTNLQRDTTTLDPYLWVDYEPHGF